jgi:hypothetical protein
MAIDHSVFALLHYPSRYSTTADVTAAEVRREVTDRSLKAARLPSRVSVHLPCKQRDIPFGFEVLVSCKPSARRWPTRTPRHAPSMPSRRAVHSPQISFKIASPLALAGTDHIFNFPFLPIHS